MSDNRYNVDHAPSIDYRPMLLGIRMTPSYLEYFGPEQHELDMATFSPDKPDPLQILGKINGDWLDDLDAGCELAIKSLLTRREHHSDYLYETELTERLPTLSKIPQLIGFKDTCYSKVHYQRPGCMLSRHCDSPWPERHFLRVLITLAPWEYGQLMMFNNKIYERWESGTILYTDYRTTTHMTVNGSYHTRPLLVITGEPNDELRSLIKENKQQNFQL